MNLIARAVRAASVTLAVLFATAVTASAITEKAIYTVRNDRGGVVIDYAIKVAKLEQSRQRVKFAGRCDSACTLYLGLSGSQLCITPSARFGFHLPFGSSSRGNVVAANFLLKKYPRWVHSWLQANGGLNSSLKVMPYEYASRFIKPCDGQTTTS